ncbi:MAG: DNA polymerase III subunit delta [Spirochaetae bacterium HGW-Spirochaetae-5]|nr:MAG: DNA polymerase III subunit delta [Spirochaetae bacterium HGW-Spirochaetae-5]
MALKKYPTSKQFAAEIAKSIKGRVFLFLGEEEGEKDKVISTILSHIFKKDEDRIQNTGKYYLNEDKNTQEEFTAAADFALAGSMFSSSRACIIRNIENIKLNDTVKNIMEDMMTSTPEGTVIIMTSMANQAPAWIEKKYEDLVNIVQFWKNFDSDLLAYIRKNLNDKKIKFEDRIIPLLIELTGNDIKKIDEMLDMISMTSNDMTLSETLVRDLAGEIREITVFEFVDSLFLKEKRSLSYLQKIIDDGTAELLILNMIIRQADTIEKYYTLLDEKNNQDEAFTKLGLAGSKLKREKFASILKRTSRPDLKRIYPLIAKTEYNLKSAAIGSSIISNPVFILASEMLLMK